MVALAAFVVLATANAAMYRYGVSDQAFYIPVVARALDPAAFPRDAALIDAQGRLMLADYLGGIGVEEGQGAVCVANREGPSVGAQREREDRLAAAGARRDARGA